MAGSRSLQRVARRFVEVMIATAIAVFSIVGLSAHSGAFTLVAAHGQTLSPSIHDGDLVLAVRGNASSARAGQVLAVRASNGYTLTDGSPASSPNGPALVAVRSVHGAGWILSFVQGALVRFVLAACMPLTALGLIARSMTRARTVGERRPAAASVRTCLETSSSSSLPALINLSERRKASPSPQPLVQQELVSACG